MADLPDDSVPDADSYEQQLSALPNSVTHVRPKVADDVPEADAIEQAQPSPLPDEDEAPS